MRNLVLAPRPAWLWDGERPRVRPVFQPIIDLTTGAPMGYEVLSRGSGPGDSAAELFARAGRERCLWELELACWTAAAQAIAALPAEARLAPFFLNLGPTALEDPRFLSGELLDTLVRHGVRPEDVVVEVTEADALADPAGAGRRLAALAREGFRFALDDFGAGHSGLVTLVHLAPHFIKLDKALVREVHGHSYRQVLLRSLVGFAARADAVLIAEGVEAPEELSTLVRLGVRAAQGYLLGRPAPLPLTPAAEGEAHRAAAAGALRVHRADGAEETIGTLALRGPCFEEGALTTEELDQRFRHAPALDHVVFLQDGRPRALVTRRHFHSLTAGPFGYPLLQKKPADLAGTHRPLMVEDGLAVTEVSELAMARPADEVYDPVVVTDSDGSFVGTVTVKQLLARATELEVLEARGLNPLTLLPGNRTIERWVRSALAEGPFTVVYGDLDHFKEYNDRYGFLAGDRLLRLTARLLGDALPWMGEGARLGHVGGDDFVLVVPREVPAETLEAVCRQFDLERCVHFDAADLEQGSFEAVDRRGTCTRVPLVTLSLAVVESSRLGEDAHPAALAGRAAGLKLQVKAHTHACRRSGFLFERRAAPPGESPD